MSTEESKDLQKMTVVVGGRSYPLKVTTAEANKIPALEKKLNDEIRHMQMAYKDLDMQDCLSMVLLTNSLSDSNGTSSKLIEEKIDDLNSRIQSSLNDRA